MLMNTEIEPHTTAGLVCFSDEPMKVFPTSAPDSSFQPPSVRAAGSMRGSMRLKADADVKYLDSQMPQMNSTMDQAIQLGSVVQFHRLALTKSLNGACGVVERWHVKKQLWVVRMGDGSEVAGKAENLQVVSLKTPRAPPGLGHPPMMGAPPQPYTAYLPLPCTPRVVTEKVVSRSEFAKLRAGKPERRLPKHNETKQQSECLRTKETRTEETKKPTTLGRAAQAQRACTPSSDSTSIGDSSSDDDETDGSKPSTHTTIMMRGIPNDFTRDTLTDLLDSQGFAGCYNLVYLPIDIQTQAACGYASIVLFTHAEAERLRIHFEGFTAWPMMSEKVCWTSWSNIDGLHCHVDRYRNLPVQHESVHDTFKPALFNKFGKRVPFPSPTKKIVPARFTVPAKSSSS